MLPRPRCHAHCPSSHQPSGRGGGAGPDGIRHGRGSHESLTALCACGCREVPPLPIRVHAGPAQCVHHRPFSPARAALLKLRRWFCSTPRNAHSRSLSFSEREPRWFGMMAAEVPWDVHMESHDWISDDGVSGWTRGALIYNSSAKVCARPCALSFPLSFRCVHERPRTSAKHVNSPLSHLHTEVLPGAPRVAHGMSYLRPGSRWTASTAVQRSGLR